jgi:hypothetical protein
MHVRNISKLVQKKLFLTLVSKDIFKRYLSLGSEKSTNALCKLKRGLKCALFENKKVIIFHAKTV